MIEFTIKTLDSTNHSFSVEDETTVEQLKQKIRDQIGLEIGLQRLIFCGRVLQDEKKLSDYDVHGKVVHLVQRAPPVLEGRSSSVPRHGGRSRHFHNMNSSGTFNGPSDEGEALPFHHEMRRLMNLADSADFGVDHYHQMSLSPTAGRMETARRLIAEIKTTLGCLRAHLAGEEVSGEPPSGEAPVEPMDSEPTPRAPPEEGEPQFDESGDEITGDTAARPTSARRRVARTMRPRHTQPRHLAQLIEELDRLNEQFAPHRANYARLLRSANDPQPPTYSGDERSHHQITVDIVAELMHTFSHAYHALSDIMFTVGNPRLSSEVAVTRHLIPMQAHINVISAAPMSRRAQPPGGAPATQTSATANEASGNAQANRGNAPGRNTTQPTVNINIQPDPVTYQLEIETRVPIAVAPFDNIFLSGLRNTRTPGQQETQNQNQNSQENQSTQRNMDAQSPTDQPNENAQQNQNGQQNQTGQQPQSQANRRQILRDLENLFRGMGQAGLGGVEVVMSMEEIPAAALGNLSNLATGNRGLNNLGGQVGQEGAVFFAPMAAFASGGPPDANMLQNILQQLLRQGLMPGPNEGVALIPPAQVPQQFHQFVNVPNQAQAAQNSSNQSNPDTDPASPGPPMSNAGTQTNMQGVDSVFVIPSQNVLLNDDEDEEDEGQNQDTIELGPQDVPMRPQVSRVQVEDYFRRQRQMPGQGQGIGQGRVSGQGHVLGQGFGQEQMSGQGHVLAQGQSPGQGENMGSIIGQAPPLRVIGNNAIYGLPQDPFAQTQGLYAPGGETTRVHALARAQAQAQVQAMAQAQVQAQQSHAQAQSQAAAHGQSQTSGQTQSASQTQVSGQAQGQQTGQNTERPPPNLQMRRAAFGNRAQSLALANMFYDRFLQCESPHARRRMQRRRNQQQLLIDHREQIRNERSAQQNIESLGLRRTQIRATHMCTIMTLLNGESSPQAYLNAFLIAVSRQLFMNDLLHASNNMPPLIPHEFHSIRMLLRTFVHELITSAATTESDHAFQGVADYLVGQYAGFINNMNNITALIPVMDPLESIRAFVRSRLPAFIASIMCDSNTDQFVARFYSMFLRMLTDLCALVYHMCGLSEAGLRRLYRNFLDHAVHDFDNPSRAAILTVGLDNFVGILPNVPNQIENILQFVRRVDGVMPDLPQRDVASPMEVTPAREEQMQTAPPAPPIVAPSPPNEEPPTTDIAPRHINISKPRKQQAATNAPATRAASSSSSSDLSGGSSPTPPPATRVAQPEPEDTRESSNSDTNIRFVPPVMILQHWGEEWVPVFTRDQQSQNSPQHPSRQMEPYSDGYMTGMPSRKRRCVRQARPPATLDGFMNESVHEATERTSTDNSAIRAAFREHMRGLARARASSSDDYDPLRYASAARFLQPRPSKNDNPESSNKENGV